MQGVGMAFDRFYRCYPAVEVHHQNAGNRVILPASALDRISAMRDVQWPLFFAIFNASPDDVDGKGRPLASHCGVLEFTAEEGTVLVPSFLMKTLQLVEHSLVKVVYDAIPVAKYLKLQPHTKAFFDDNSNVKEVLEVALKRLSCVTVGDTVMVPHNGEEYALDVVEAKPENAVSIIETDCEVDFAMALDDLPLPPPAPHVEEKMVSANIEHGGSHGSTGKFAAFSGEARRVDGAIVEAQLMQQKGDVGMTFNENAGGDARKKGKEECTCEGLHGQGKDEEKPKFQAFSGKKYSLLDINN